MYERTNEILKNLAKIYLKNCIYLKEKQSRRQNFEKILRNLAKFQKYFTNCDAKGPKNDKKK